MGLNGVVAGGVRGDDGLDRAEKTAGADADAAEDEDGIGWSFLYVSAILLQGYLIRLMMALGLCCRVIFLSSCG